MPFTTDPDGTLHETYSAEYFLHGTYLGGLQYDSGRSDLGWHRSSVAFFCPTCGDTWARMVVTASEGRACHFDVERVGCERHFDLWNIPGSTLVGRLEGLVEDLPPALLRREFEVHLRWAEKELES